jgi:hypothetical protein
MPWLTVNFIFKKVNVLLLFFKEKPFKINYNKAKQKHYYKYTYQINRHINYKVLKRLAGVNFFIPKFIYTVCQQQACAK